MTRTRMLFQVRFQPTKAIPLRQLKVTSVQLNLNQMSLLGFIHQGLHILKTTILILPLNTYITVQIWTLVYYKSIMPLVQLIISLKNMTMLLLPLVNLDLKNLTPNHYYVCMFRENTMNLKKEQKVISINMKMIFKQQLYAHLLIIRQVKKIFIPFAKTLQTLSILVS